MHAKVYVEDVRTKPGKVVEGARETPVGRVILTVPAPLDLDFMNWLMQRTGKVVKITLAEVPEAQRELSFQGAAAEA